METNFFFKNMADAEEGQLREYFLKKLPALEKILSQFPSDAINLQVKGERFEKHSAYEVELTLKLPSETFTSKEASHMITKAVDLAKDRLVIQLKKKSLSQKRTHRSLKAKAKAEIRIGMTV